MNRHEYLQDGLRGLGNTKGGGVLDWKNRANLGHRKILASPVFSGAPSTIFTGNSGNSFLPGFIDIAGEIQANPQLVVLAVSALPLPNPTASPLTAEQVLIQGKLQFGIGDANFGLTEQTVSPFFQAPVVFDIGEGTLVTIPASGFFKLDVTYTGVRLTGGGFAAGDILGNPFAVNAGLAYGHAKSVPVTKTDPMVTIVAGGNASFTKPNFAQSFSVTWNEYGGAGAVGPVDIRFTAWSGAFYYRTQIPTPGPTVPPIFPWPADAIAVQVLNGGGAPITNVKVVHNLFL